MSTSAKDLVNNSRRRSCAGQPFHPFRQGAKKDRGVFERARATAELRERGRYGTLPR
jgi:hypothetical protein